MYSKPILIMGGWICFLTQPEICIAWPPPFLPFLGLFQFHCITGL